MPSLRETQDLFARALLRGEPTPELAALVRGPADRSAHDSIAVYVRNYRGSLHRALEETYPVTRSLVGENYFTLLASHYIAGHPSTSRNLNAYGARFGEFLQEILPTRPEAAHLEYVADVAKLEWCWYWSYHAADNGPFDFDALAQVMASEEIDIRLLPSRSLSLISSPYPVHEIWSLVRSGSLEAGYILRRGDYRIVVSRTDGFIPRIRAVSREFWDILRRVVDGDSLKQICLDHSGEDDPEALVGFVAEAVRSRWIAGFETHACGQGGDDRESA
ncbi:HvfC/BufC N-terminal domain-containing protein [Tautonia sociabilis]|uniref:DUF2063 domain-containing protein n=1 Tax=Tautonia sociabilis TaxID=2080755 RepID=A0A432MLD6_9BACT|nr:DNA-binding domain-containing protein [Tautonia sociabilis]RUL87946.1 DUF2063 domain-containing protein [Tautonia sociabilis]